MESVFLWFIMQIMVNSRTEQSKTISCLLESVFWFCSFCNSLTLIGKKYKLCELLSKDKGQYILVISS